MDEANQVSWHLHVICGPSDSAKVGIWWGSISFHMQKYRRVSIAACRMVSASTEPGNFSAKAGYCGERDQ